MTAIAQFLRDDSRLDRLAIMLSGLCIAHCLASAILVALLASAGGILGAGWVHEAGLAIAIMLGTLALGQGYRRHGRAVPLAVGAAGLVVMAAALALPHGAPETLATLGGVALLAFAHYRNGRSAR